MMTPSTIYGDVWDEFRGFRFADERLRQRSMTVVAALSEKPGASLPEIAGTPAALEAMYRLVNNKRVKWSSLLAAHAEQSRQRCAELGEVLAIHDTTKFQFGGEAARTGVGWLPGGGQGFFGHFCLAVSADGKRLPLGVMGMEPIVRTEAKKGKRSPKVSKADPTRESLRWARLAMQVETGVGGAAEVIHVMDREADDYETLAELAARPSRFVIRVTHRARGVYGEDAEGERHRMTVHQAASHATSQLTREVPLSPRSDKGRSTNAKAIHPARECRLAQLTVASTHVEARRSRHASGHLPKTLGLNVVHVVEPEPPAGEVPIEWLLWTTEPVDTPEQLERVVDIYRARWTIEEFFKAIKTGCAFEKRQLGSLDGLLTLLALVIPVAWRLLLLRNLGRDEPDTPATAALTTSQLAVLHAISKRSLADNLTVGDAMLAIAELGGYQRSKHPPGWIVLGKGLQHLLIAEEGWRAARARDV